MEQVQFVDVFKGVLVERVKLIEGDKIKAQRLRITRKPIPPQLAWNVTLGERAQSHIDESDEFKRFILERIEGQRKYNETHVNLASLVHMQHAKLEGDGDGDEESDMDSTHMRQLEATIHQKRGQREAQARLAALKADASSASSNSFELISDHSDHPLDDTSSLGGSIGQANASGVLIEGSSLVETSLATGSGTAKTGRTRFKKVKKTKSAAHTLPGVQGVLSEKRHDDGHVAETLMFR